MIWAMNLDQVMIVGEGFEGYIKKLDVNFMPYALTINQKVHKYLYIYITPIIFSILSSIIRPGRLV